MATRIQATFDAADPPALAAFWGELLGYVEQDPPEGFDSWEAWAVANEVPRERWGDYDARVDPDGAGPRLYFQRGPWPPARPSFARSTRAASTGSSSRTRRATSSACTDRGPRVRPGSWPGPRGW